MRRPRAPWPWQCSTATTSRPWRPPDPPSRPAARLVNGPTHTPAPVAEPGPAGRAVPPANPFAVTVPAPPTSWTYTYISYPGPIPIPAPPRTGAMGGGGARPAGPGRRRALGPVERGGPGPSAKRPWIAPPPRPPHGSQEAGGGPGPPPTGPSAAPRHFQGSRATPPRRSRRGCPSPYNGAATWSPFRAHLCPHLDRALARGDAPTTLSASMN